MSLSFPGVLKDVPRSPLEMLRDADNDADRMSLYPNLDYKGLFNAISQLVDAAPHLQYGIQGRSEKFFYKISGGKTPVLIARRYMRASRCLAFTTASISL